jgi:hypothetical protein
LKLPSLSFQAATAAETGPTNSFVNGRHTIDRQIWASTPHRANCDLGRTTNESAKRTVAFVRKIATTLKNSPNITPKSLLMQLSALRTVLDGKQFRT